MDQHPHPLEGKYEPESRDVQTPLEAAYMSIAISLKRIADHLDERVAPKAIPTTGFRLTNSRAAKAIIREMTHDR